MIVAAGQFAVTPDWKTNALTCVELMAQAAQQQASLLVLPEALLARDDADPHLSVKSAQRLDGGFLHLLLEESRRNSMTTILTVHVPSSEGRAVNTLVALYQGKSLHSMQSSISMMHLVCRSRHGWMQATFCHR